MKSHESSKDEDCDLLKTLPWIKIAPIVIFLPLFALGFSVGYSIQYDFTYTTKTHCQVYNLLPSISAAIGEHEPQRSVWKWCIVLHSPPRYLAAILYLIFYTSVAQASWKQTYGFLVMLICGLNLVEMTALLGLTLISSSYDLDTHKFSFITFIIASVFYMMTTLYVQTSIFSKTTVPKMRLSVKLKKIILLINVISLVAAGYFYHRHNTYCEPGVYSFFGLSEYIFVVSNVAFHATNVLDFSSYRQLLTARSGIPYQSV